MDAPILCVEMVGIESMAADVPEDFYETSIYAASPETSEPSTKGTYSHQSGSERYYGLAGVDP